MSFFRRKADTEPTSARLMTGAEAERVVRLVQTADHRLLTSDIVDLPRLLSTDPTAVLETGDRLVGLASFGWRAQPVAWLRTLVLQGQVATAAALQTLCGPLYAVLRAEGYTLATVTLDEWNEPWLRRPLHQLGYQPMVEVVGYEKLRFDVPARGNQVVSVRRAVPSDLQAVLGLDAACFPLPWVKGAEVLEPAIRTSPYCIIAGFGGELVGYAFVTGHHGGNLYHLVRIAVAPAYQSRAIGVRLLAEIVEFCARQDAAALSLNTQADNRPAQRLYEWFGFARTGDRQTVLGHDLT